MSDFAGLRIALSSLYAQRRGVELAAHNVANVNTEGYSRQRVDLTNMGAPAVPAFWSTYQGDGQGVRVEGITRYRDQFLEIRAGLEHAALADLEQHRATLDRLQELFNEPSDLGLGKQLADFWAGFDDLANHPSDTAARTQVLERAGTLVATFHATSEKISQMRLDTTSELSAVIAEVNTTSATIAQLNKSIKTATVAGLTANDLKDQRDLLANRLAELTGATVRPGEFEQVNVFLNGTALVQDDFTQQLSIDTSNPAATVLRWTSTNFQAVVTSGTAGGMLDAMNTTLPGYLAQLDAVAMQLRDSVNALHSEIGGSLAATARNQSAAGNLQFDVALDGGAYSTVTVAGADWSGAGGAAALQGALQAAVDSAVGAGNVTVTVSGAAGEPLSVSVVPTGTHTLTTKATGTNAGYTTLLGGTAVGADGVGGRQFFTGTDAASFDLSADIASNPNAITAGTAGGGPLDASRALDLAELASSASGADASYRALIVQLGVDTQAAQRRHEIQRQSAANLDDARQAQSGVNIDEEMTNLIQYQHAYDAAARFMTTIDEMLDTLINHTGIVR
jgi:flagellar hook-associated protein 1 FlgK